MLNFIKNGKKSNAIKSCALLVLFLLTTTSSLSAENLFYQFESYCPTNPKVIKLELGSTLYIQGDKEIKAATGKEMQDAENEGHATGFLYCDGTHCIKFEGGGGAKTGTKTIYNASLWKLDPNSLSNNKSLVTIQDDTQRGEWSFLAKSVTPAGEKPQELLFTNEKKEVFHLKVKVVAPEEDYLNRAHRFE